MKKVIAIICIIAMLTMALSGCLQKQCALCESTDVEYEALFVPSGTSEYLCEKCYQKRNENPTFDDFWVVEPV
ncbi:MAG: hypothetical protein IJY91_01845 [Oscillospiraceae bacterium]|nr:hypothetical protein [Oscillospiraceae bacterium]